MKKAAHRQGSSASRPVRCAVSCLPLSHLRHEVAHGLGCFILLLAGGVGVGPEGKPGVVVSQHGGDCLNVHTVLKGPGGFGVATGPREGAGYGLAFQARRETVLAVVTIGYADGLPRQLSQAGGEALLRGRRCPMAGRMCMDQLFLDVTDVPEVRPGDLVTLIGRDGGQEITAREVAERCGTITNELLSRLGGRLTVLERRWSDPPAC